ncbi:hypothetical protein [Haladaptatus salinisoli]|uniref:hypothetical protein n=1 Tax=Haladaptatus salinisoli TaxID=2884876 RepID=UPI001D0A6DEA|nr:hypothetical protein [Haladaptatus salinisoli]
MADHPREDDRVLACAHSIDTKPHSDTPSQGIVMWGLEPRVEDGKIALSGGYAILFGEHGVYHTFVAPRRPTYIPAVEGGRTVIFLQVNPNVPHSLTFNATTTSRDEGEGGTVRTTYPQLKIAAIDCRESMADPPVSLYNRDSESVPEGTPLSFAPRGAVAPHRRLRQIDSPSVVGFQWGSDASDSTSSFEN